MTGTWGDFILPRGEQPVLMVAAGIGVTPFVSQLRQLQATGQQRDVVLVYVASDASELAFREELAATGVRTVVFTRDEPADLPAHWSWAQGARLDAETLERTVADLAARHAFISGPRGSSPTSPPPCRKHAASRPTPSPDTDPAYPSGQASGCRPLSPGSWGCGR